MFPLRYLRTLQKYLVLTVCIEGEFKKHKPANVKENLQQNLGFASGPVRLLQSWRLSTILLRRLLLGIWDVAVATNLITGDDPWLSAASATQSLMMLVVIIKQCYLKYLLTKVIAFIGFTHITVSALFVRNRNILGSFWSHLVLTDFSSGDMKPKGWESLWFPGSRSPC